MQTRTWPYGTVKRVKVLNVEFAKHKGNDIRILFCEEIENPREGHCIVGDCGDECKAGDIGIITFTKGGQTGGYWKYRKGDVTE